MSDVTYCHPNSILDNWSKQEWSDGIQVDRLRDLEEFTVHTRNSQYEFTVLSGHSGEVLVRGGMFFPCPTRARLAGSSLGGSFLKLLGVYLGFRMELHVDGQRIVTTAVESIGLPKDGPVTTPRAH